MPDNNLVSIITPSYNCAKFISDTIQSVQSQTYKYWEMIIVDDCSTDNTIKLIRTFLDADPRIRLICNKKNEGTAFCRNLALKEAKGRWIAFIDSDDLWKADKLEHQLDFMNTHNYHFSYHKYSEIDEETRSLGIQVGGKRKVSRFDMYTCCWPGCLTVMYDRKYVGLIQIENIRRNNDTAMWLEVVRKTPCYLLSEDLAFYRKRRGSITPTSIIDKIKAHYPLFRVARRMNPLAAYFWIFLNIIGNGIKKIFYVEKI